MGKEQHLAWTDLPFSVSDTSSMHLWTYRYIKKSGEMQEVSTKQLFFENPALTNVNIIQLVMLWTLFLLFYSYLILYLETESGNRSSPIYSVNLGD